MRRFPLCIFLSFFFFLSACQFDSVKPSSSGKPGEMVIVIDSLQWKGAVGMMLRDTLQEAVPGIPQFEPSLTLVNVAPGQFRNILQAHRNVLMVETGPVSGGKAYALTQKRNVWAEPQLVLNLRAADAQSLQQAVGELAVTIREKFLEEDRTRASMSLSQSPKSKTAAAFSGMSGISIPLPEDFYIARNDSSYFWLRKETVNTSIGLQVYSFPYSDDSSFTPGFIISLRDSLCKKHIPGPVEGSYMTTDRNVPVTISNTTIDDAYAVMIRGLWRTEGDFMGGPFISYLVHDKNRSVLWFFDYYIYAPKFNKRSYVRHAEALIQSVTLH